MSRPFVLDQLRNAQEQILEIGTGVQIFENTNRNSSNANIKKIKGRTIVNYVPLFNSGLWSFHANVTVDSATKITLNATANLQNSSIQIPVKENTSYTLSLITQNIGAYSYIHLKDSSGTVLRTIDNIGSGTTGKSQNTFTTDAGTSFISIHLSNGSSGTGVYEFENIMLNEGLESYEFVESIKSLTNLHIERKGKNLLPSAYNSNRSSLTVINESYKITINGNSSAHYAMFSVNVEPNEEYTLKVDHNGYILVIERDKYGTEILRPVDYQQGQLYIFTTSSNSSSLDIYLHSNSNPQTFTFENWMFNIGSTPLPFEPQNNDVIYINDSLRSTIDGTYDEAYERDGKLYKLKKIDYKILDGSLNWTFHIDNVGFKQVRIPISNVYSTVALNEYTIVKYNGLILKKNDLSLADGSMLGDVTGAIAETELVISISDIDSGWGEERTTGSTWTASFWGISRDANWSDMIKAYFNGWKWVRDPNGDENYTDSHWVSIYDSGVTSTNVDEVINRNIHIENGKIGYQIQYKLSQQPVEVEIDAQLGFFLNDGYNQIEVNEGFILGEIATPQLSGDGTAYHINSGIAGYESSHLKYRTKKINFIYKNGEVDNNWIITNIGTSNGLDRAYIPSSNYDSSSVYTVDYIPLDKYLITSNVESIELEYETSLSSILNNVVQVSADNEGKISVIERDYARKTHGQWFEAQLLNGWVNYNDDRKANYTIDEFGFVVFKGAIKDGVIAPTGFTTPAFILPLRYRPYANIELPIVSSNNSLGNITIRHNGEVYIRSGNNAWISLENVRFTAK